MTNKMANAHTPLCKYVLYIYTHITSVCPAVTFLARYVSIHLPIYLSKMLPMIFD